MPCARPGNLPPGFGPSPGKVLQARLLAYADAHRHRIGINHTQLDVNKPRCPVHSYHRDGNDDYTQAGDLYRMMDEEAKGRLVDNIVGAMQGGPPDIQVRQIGHFMKADPAYGEGVAMGLGIEPADVG